MAKFISIPVTNKGITLVSTDGLCTEFSNSTTIKLAGGGRLVTLTILGTATAATLAAINDAALTLNGPTLVPVVFPAGQTCTTVNIT